MAYTTINKSTDYFNTKLYTGNGSTNAITGVGFQPDWVWIKGRSYIDGHKAYDAVRGVAKDLTPNTTDAEGSTATGLTAFDSDGFTLGSWSNVNRSSETHVSWNWKANGQGSANSDGSITTTYTSANTTSGFSIVTYTGNGTGGATIGHGLGTAPACVIVKNRTSSTYDWLVYHKGLGATKYMALNQTDASTTSAIGWNDTAPTSSVITLGTANAVNTNSSDYVAYCFAEKTGFSKFGSYTGNGSADGSFIYTGFKPAWLIIKRTDSADSWFMYDNKRNSFNVIDDYLIASSTTAETNSASVNMDFLSNGVKIRNTDGGHNASGGTYIYMAFAEAPLVGSNNVPATAR